MWFGLSRSGMKVKFYVNGSGLIYQGLGYSDRSDIFWEWVWDKSSLVTHLCYCIALFSGIEFSPSLGFV